MIDTTTVAAGHAKQPFYKHLYFQVLVAIIAGIALGHFYPAFGEQSSRSATALSVSSR